MMVTLITLASFVVLSAVVLCLGGAMTAESPVTQRVRQAMVEEITVEDRINEEARQILLQHQDHMRNSGISYQDMFKKVKAQLARDKKLVLR